jgi:hypothetical protein
MAHANDRLFDHQMAREFKLKKTRALVDKRMDLSDAVAQYVEDGDSLIETGFAYARGPMAAYWEIGRQKKQNLVGIYTPGGLNNLWHEFGGIEGLSGGGSRRVPSRCSPTGATAGCRRRFGPRSRA